MGILDNLTPQEKIYYKDLYKIADSDKDGVISGMDALSFFRKSKLSDIQLGKIWTLADSQGKGFLSEEEFYLSLRMIAIFQDEKEPTIELAQVPGSKLPNFPEYPPPQIAPSGSSAAATISNNASSAAPSGHQWVITPPERQHYKNMFKSQDTDNDGFVTGDQARQFFGKSGLGIPDLAKVWNLADITKDSKLDETEFCIAMHIITYRLKGIPIPDVLPPSLLSNLPPVTAEEKKRYSEVFRKADPNNDKFINGEQARKLFGKSGLDTTTLAKIWTLSDQDKDHQLSENEFILAMYLINSKLKGIDIPDVIPKVVLDSIVATPTAAPAPSPKELPKPNYDVKLDDLASHHPPAAQTPIMPSGLVPPTHLLPPPGTPVAPLTPVQPLGATPVVAVGGATVATPVVQQAYVIPNAASPSSSFVNTAPVRPQVDPKQIAALETRKEELTKELAEEQSQNQHIEKEVAAETESLNKLQAEVKHLEQQVGDEKTKGIQLKEQLKYVKLQISNLKVQKEQFDKIISEKNEQFTEEQDLYNILAQELSDKTAELKRQQEEIARLSSGVDSLRVKRKEAKDQLLDVKKQLAEVAQKKPVVDYSSQEESVGRGVNYKSSSSKPASGYSSANETHHSAPATPALPPKQPQAQQAQLQPQATSSAPEFPVSFGTTDSFGSSDFGKPFDFNGAAQAFPAPEPAPAPSTSTAVPHEEAHAAFGTSGFDNPFGQDAFGSASFDSGHSRFGEIHKFDTGADGFGSSSTSLKGSGEKSKEDDPFHFDADLKAAADQSADSFGGSASNTTAFGAPDSWANFGQDAFGSSTSFDNGASTFDSGASTFGSGFVDEGKDSFG